MPKKAGESLNVWYQVGVLHLSGSEGTMCAFYETCIDTINVRYKGTVAAHNRAPLWRRRLERSNVQEFMATKYEEPSVSIQPLTIKHPSLVCNFFL